MIFLKSAGLNDRYVINYWLYIVCMIYVIIMCTLYCSVLSIVISSDVIIMVVCMFCHVKTSGLHKRINMFLEQVTFHIHKQ